MLVTLALRIVFLSAFTTLFDHLIPLGTSPALLWLAVLFGATTASGLAFSRLNQLGFMSVTGSFLLGLALLTKLTELIPVVDSLIFAPYIASQHATTLTIIFLIAFVTSWCFWRFKWTLLVETLLIGLTIISVLALHRDYRLDLPKSINNLAWSLGLDQLSVFVLFGAAATLLLWFYLVAGSLPGRPNKYPFKQTQTLHRSRHSLMAKLFVVAIGLTALFFIGQSVYNHFKAEMLSRIAGGVGQAKDEGLSPLGFHDSIGGSNQPAALVRLEGDYPGNPFSPMLYLREGALSSFNGLEMVIAGRAFDKDVNHTSPFEAYSVEANPDLVWRAPLHQAIYLLADHQNAFAIDYPLSITPLKNPNTQRFKAAYKVYSMVPALSLDKLAESEVGDPKWSSLEKQHYLVTHPDSRYQEMALQITAELKAPVRKAAALAQHLSTHAIYTLTPNHAVKAGEDPVAAFLFGDLRGYCVHFAHSMVYMLRALGIPARIGSGYLTDLSEAKDGHILLRISDRHAWAEVYIDQFGWMPFDVTPTQVESHANTQVDVQLLEELMGLLDPGEEILPTTPLREEANVYAPSSLKLPSLTTLLIVAATALLLLYLLKVYLLFSWSLPASAWCKLKRANRAVTILLCDLGITREIGETRLEFSQRVAAEMGAAELKLPKLFGLARYSREGRDSIPPETTVAALTTDAQNLKQLPKSRRLKALLGLNSVFQKMAGGLQ